ncbi:MAG: lactate utilization protein, partial [Desulfobacterales bacterium]|nr:lactate utilization protein [Desulfobacterales bacterium]
DPKEASKYTERVTKEATLSDVFLTGTNALTQDGRLVNVDGNGNRVAGMFWGHPISIIVVGKNKIVRDLDEAFHRIRNTIAPNHAYIRTAASRGRKLKIPCAETGECRDCRSSDRVCNIFTILEGKPFHTDLNVIIVDEDLGLGWDASWPKSRIKQIIDNHKKFLWIPMFDVL